MDYDILKVIDDMELDFIDRIRRHQQKYLDLGCEDWKRMQLGEIKRFRIEVREMLEGYRREVAEDVEYNLKHEYEKQWRKEFRRMKATNTQFARSLMLVDPRPTFHKVNDRRMIAMLNAVKKDFDDACLSLYRQADDIYRQLIFRATVMVNSGSYDLLTAINTANRDMLANGVQSVPYKSHETGKVIRMVSTRAYCEMALRTNMVRTAIQAQANIRDYLEIYTVRVSDHQSSCPLCGKWQGKILIDDVYSNGTPDGKHQLLSTAIDGGLLHPNCRHILATYTEGVDDNYGDRQYTKEDEKLYKAEQKQRAIERDIRKAKREAMGTIDGNKKVQNLQDKLRKHLQENDKLRRKRWRESD